MFEPTWDSVAQHSVPDWYGGAKLGVFVHWGLYSVPGWAPQVPDIQELLERRGPAAILRENPYAEWYLNTSRLTGSPTWTHQRDTYGPDATYDDFVPVFDDGSAEADMDAIAAVCRDAGARYVILTTKHHDGFCLWPTAIRHPRRGHYHARRDIVGDLRTAVLAAGMRMGLYYSGGYDWPFNDALLSSPADLVLAVPATRDYADYATAHVRELIDRYQPSVLWNDICWPAAADLPALFADYYNSVPDGLVNDRWMQSTPPRGPLGEGLVRLAGLVAQQLWPVIPARFKTLTFPTNQHFDVRTPEYAAFDAIQADKWESTRGVGHSFGANRNERPQDMLTGPELIASFADIVSKNGNLLIGIGPDEHGRFPDGQVAPLRALGDWLRVNGEAVYDTAPWEVAEATTGCGLPVRFTRGASETNVIVLGTPRGRFSLPGFDACGVDRARVLGLDEPLDWGIDDGVLTVCWPDRLPVAAAHVVAVSGTLRPGR